MKNLSESLSQQSNVTSQLTCNFFITTKPLFENRRSTSAEEGVIARTTTATRARIGKSISCVEKTLTEQMMQKSRTNTNYPPCALHCHPCLHDKKIETSHFQNNRLLVSIRQQHSLHYLRIIKLGILPSQ